MFRQNTGPLRGHLNSTRKCKPRTVQDDVLAEAAAARAALFGARSRNTAQPPTAPLAQNTAANTRSDTSQTGLSRENLNTASQLPNIVANPGNEKGNSNELSS